MRIQERHDHQELVRGLLMLGVVPMVVVHTRCENE